VGLVVHGGGEKAYTASHPAVALLTETFHCSSVHSVMLPFHGPAHQKMEDIILEKKSTPEQVAVYLELLMELISPIVRSKNIICIGYSMGGLSMLKIWPRIQSIASRHIGVFVGGALEIDSTDALIQFYWTRDNFVQTKKLQGLLNLHGSNERVDRMIYFVYAFSGFKDTGLYTTHEDRVVMFGGGSKSQGQKSSHQPSHNLSHIYLFSGSEEIPFPPEECINSVLQKDQELNPAFPASAVMQHNVRIIENGTHFDYFNQRVGLNNTWLKLRQLIIESIGNSLKIYQSNSHMSDVSNVSNISSKL
jgi:hypothetical protein